MTQFQVPAPFPVTKEVPVPVSYYIQDRSMTPYMGFWSYNPYKIQNTALLTSASNNYYNNLNNEINKNFNDDENKLLTHFTMQQHPKYDDSLMDYHHKYWTNLMYLLTQTNLRHNHMGYGGHESKKIMVMVKEINDEPSWSDHFHLIVSRLRKMYHILLRSQLKNQ